MKVFIVSVAVVLLYTSFLVYVHDYNMHQRYTYKLKFVAEEAAAGAAQYIQPDEYAEGNVVFNRSESIEAAEHLIKQNMELDDNFIPHSDSYWSEEVTYEIEFFDDSNTVFPYYYQDGPVAITLTDPSVAIKINAGKARYMLVDNPPDVIRRAIHTWKER